MIWQPNRVSLLAMAFLATVALAALSAVNTFKIEKRQPHYSEKLAAATRMKKGMAVVKEKRGELYRRLGDPYGISMEYDPAGSGLIGLEESDITSDAGNLQAKQTSANPNLAAVVIEWLKSPGLKLSRDDYVAVGVSGSFPAANMAVIIACETLGLRPLVISSTSASMYGANLPEFTWLDIETALLEAGVIKTRSLAATLGGGEDVGATLSSRGRQILRDAMTRNGVPFLEPRNLEESFKLRMELYRKEAGKKPIKLYVNVGGSLGSIGSRINRTILRPGLTRNPPRTGYPTRGRGPMVQFAEMGTPILSITGMRKIIEKHRLPVAPAITPRPGDGDIFSRKEYSLWLTGGLLAGLALLTFLGVRVDMRYYLARMRRLYGMERPGA